jgi:hypothetical protein
MYTALRGSLSAQRGLPPPAPLPIRPLFRCSSVRPSTATIILAKACSSETVLADETTLLMVDKIQDGKLWLEEQSTHRLLRNFLPLEGQWPTLEE